MTSFLATTSGGLGAGLLVLLVVALTAAADWLRMLVDVMRREEGELRAGSKVVWVIVIVTAGAIGAGVDQVVGRPRTA